MRQLVRLNKRTSSDGSRFTYVLCYTDDTGKRRWETLGHGDKRRAERQRTEKEWDRHFNKILARAGIDHGQFHDLRRTAICNWFAEGLGELEVMHLAGHANFATTHRYYLKVRDDLVHRARQATARGLCQKLVQIGAASDIAGSGEEERVVTTCNSKALGEGSAEDD